MTVGDAIRKAAKRLAPGSDTARLDAELLMAHALGMNRSDMLLRTMRDEEPAEFDPLVERRAAHEPVAYITGVQEFYGRTFRVMPEVLIPRGDSETLIDVALEIAPHARSVLDLGTGSGALIVTALLELDGARGVAVDASKPALAIAEQNARSLGLDSEQAKFAERDWGVSGWSDGLGMFDLILCNPPYVEADATLDRDVREYEPASALFAGADGLDDYRVLFPQICALMAEGGAAIFEIGAAQADSTTEIAQSCGFTTEIRLDLAKRPRALVLR